MLFPNILRRIQKCNFILIQHKAYLSSKGNLLESTLANGLSIVTEKTESPLACIGLFARVGSRFESNETNGICHFIEHMAYRGFCTINKESLARYLNDIGAKMYALTTREYQVFTATCPGDKASDVVELLAKIVTELALLDDDMNAERKNIIQEMQDLDVDPKAVMFDYLHETAFQGTPLGKRVIGPSRNINSFNRDCAYYFMKMNYTPSRLLLATSGNVSHSSVRKAASRHFANVTCEGNKAAYAPRRFTASQIIYRDDSMPFAHVALAVEAPGRDSGDCYPLLVAKHLVGAWDRSQGGAHGHASPLARASAAGNCCERFESFYIPYSDVGLWGIYYVAPRPNLETMAYNIQSVWMRICTVLGDNDVQRAIQATKLELAKRVEGAVNSCFDIGQQIIVKNDWTPLSTAFEAVSQLNAKTVKAIANKYIYDKALAVAAVGPTETIPDYSRLQAGQYWLRL